MNAQQTLSAPLPRRKREHHRISTVPTIMRQGRLTPWLYLVPAFLVMLMFIVYPAIQTLYLSFRTLDGSAWAGQSCTAGQPCWGLFENYRYALSSGSMVRAFLNNLSWILTMVTCTVAFGLIIAALANRVRYESVAKAVIFLPAAISFVGAGIIWRFVYDYGTGDVQIGVLNAILQSFGSHPVSWLTIRSVNTLALIVVGVWMYTGFCMVVLSAAIKNVSSDLLEAAVVDGASNLVMFVRITLPMILPTLTVITTTMIITVLKIFDIVYVMTGGNYETDVIANRMYIEQYTNYNTGHAAAIAVLLILIVSPAMVINIRRFRAEEAIR